MFQANAHLRRKIKTFWAKWGGLIIAAVVVVPISIFGGIALSYNSRVEFTLTNVTQNIDLVPPYIAFSTIQVDPPSSVYHLKLQVNNPTSGSARVTLSGVNLALDEFKLPVTPTNAWQQDIAPASASLFEGNIVLTPEVVSQLTQRGTAKISVTGSVKGSAQYGWVQKETSQPIDISVTISFTSQ